MNSSQIQQKSAITTIRGFQTPAASGDEDSDYGCNTPARYNPKITDIVSANCSPSLKPFNSPGIGGISRLKLQLDTLNLENESRTNSMRNQEQSQPQSSTATTSDDMSDDERSESVTYEIPLEHDFVSESVREQPILGGAIEGGLVQDTIARKMAADDFEPLKCLGKGTFGTVILVKQRTTGTLFAQKQFKKASLTIHKQMIEQTKTERSILESVNRHPFVVKLFYAFQDHEKLYLILEYGQGGELFRHLQDKRMFSEEMASFYMAEMVLALEHLHRNLGVVYRDLKPENCLLDAEGHLLLTDFGLSKVAVDENDKCNSMLGTVDYMAPEIILGQKYGKAVDWWSFGALGYDLLTGAPPFQGSNHKIIQDRITKQKLAMPYFLGPDAKDLLTRLLRKEPNKRLGAHMPKDMIAIKKHRFFRRIDWVKLAKREVEAPIQPFITDPELAENFSEDFTELPLSPVITSQHIPWSAASKNENENNPFGGFSYVASQSLLDSNGFSGTYENNVTA